jgi:hypothetical protein
MISALIRINVYDYVFLYCALVLLAVCVLAKAPRIVVSTCIGSHIFCVRLQHVGNGIMVPHLTCTECIFYGVNSLY